MRISEIIDGIAKQDSNTICDYLEDLVKKGVLTKTNGGLGCCRFYETGIYQIGLSGNAVRREFGVAVRPTVEFLRSLSPEDAAEFREVFSVEMLIRKA